MSEIQYNETHEWVRIEGDIATIGISVFAQEQLGDVVYVELPEVGTSATKGGQVAVVESVKAASEIYTPLSGTIIEINQALGDNPALVNEAPLDAGWFFKLKLSDISELSDLLDEDSYLKTTKEAH